MDGLIEGLCVTDDFRCKPVSITGKLKMIRLYTLSALASILLHVGASQKWQKWGLKYEI
jgi:hypothetical protein